jgi:phage/plasmid-associated DNA primase
VADPVRAFTRSAIVPAPEKEIAAAELYAAFARWVEAEGHAALSPAGFGRKLTALKFERVKRGGAIFYRGVDVAPAARLH